MVAEQADSVPSSFATSFCPSCQVTTTLTRPTTSNQITSSSSSSSASGEERGHWSSQLQNWTSRCSPTIPNSILDVHHQRHSMMSIPHMSSGQKSCSHTSQSLTIRVRPNPSSGHGSQGCHRKEGLCRRSLARDHWADQWENSRPWSHHFRCTSRPQSRRSSRQNQGRNQSSWKQESIKRINIHKSRQLSQVCLASLNISGPQLHGSSRHENVKLGLTDSDVVTALEIWRQVVVTYEGSAQTRVVALLKQIMTHTQWNPEKSTNVFHMYHHWLKLISKYESLSSEKIASSIKIGLALQNVRGPLANHTLLINYLNNSITHHLEENDQTGGIQWRSAPAPSAMNRRLGWMWLWTRWASLSS